MMLVLLSAMASYYLGFTIFKFGAGRAFIYRFDAYAVVQERLVDMEWHNKYCFSYFLTFNLMV
jgi:hypothetical protein